MAGPHLCSVAPLLLLLATVGLATAMPPEGVEEHRQAEAVEVPQETFDKGFPEDFAQNLPTQEFMGDFARRVRRQTGVTSAIESILSSPWDGSLASDHLQALLQRNTNLRPARQSPEASRSPSIAPLPSSSSSSRFPAFSQGSVTRPPSFRPQQEARTPDPPSSRRPFISPGLQTSSNSRRPPQFSPPRVSTSNLPSQPRETPQRPRPTRPFSSTSFTGQQFASITDIDSFFDSARLPRQRRDVAAVTGATSDAASPVSPDEGFTSDTVTSLLNHDNRDVRHSRHEQQEQQQKESRDKVFGQASSHPFAVPFVVPNLFEPSGIRRRSDVFKAPQGRQRKQVGVTAAIEAILAAPYEGPVPDSLRSLFRSEDRRVVRKTPSPSGQPQVFSVVGSDDPSQAAVRLFPRAPQTSPFSRPAAPRPSFSGTPERSRRNVGQRGTADLQHNGPRFNTNGVRLSSGEAGHHNPEEWAASLPEREFGDIIVHYEFEVEDPAEQDPGRLVTLPEDEVDALLTSFNERPARPPSPREAKPYPIPSKRKPSPHPRPHPGRPSPPQQPFRQRHRHPNLIPGLRPGPSPPAHILPSSSTVRAPRHVLRENLRLPRATRQQDIPLTRRIQLLHDPADPEAARQDSRGFIEGKPDNFPGFASIGGFGPMGDVDETDGGDSFTQTINFPTVDFGSLDDFQPSFPQTPSFPQQVSTLRGDTPLDPLLPLPYHFPQHPSEGPTPPDNHNINNHNQGQDDLLDDDFTLNHNDPHPSPPSPPPPPPPPPLTPSFNAIPARRPQRPSLRPPRPSHTRPKRLRNRPVGVRNFLRDFGQLARPQQPRGLRQTRDIELNSNSKARRRRAALSDEEEKMGDTDASLTPHKQVHRVQAVSITAPHSRQPRDFDFESSPAEVPHYFSSVSQFEFPRLQPRRRQSSALGRSAQVTGSRLFGRPYPADLRREDRDDPHAPDEDFLKPEGQRFFPAFNGHHPPAPFTPSRPPFFPSAPVPPRIPPPRGGRFFPRGVGYRDSPSTGQRDQFRDVHHQGPAVREPSRIKPDTTFSPASRRPFHREQEHFGHDNSILGSGNFEVLRGGTFYDLDDTNGHQHGYDHLLHDEEFVLFPSRRPHHPSPPRTNYVDDFFSNFRDFSEFAVRRSDEGETTQYDTDYYRRGYGSEHVHLYSNASNTTLPEKNTTSNKTTETNADATSSDPRNEQGSTDDANTAASSHPQQRPHRQPKNIQEVLEEVDPHPSDYTSTSVAVQEKDPMIAMF